MPTPTIPDGELFMNATTYTGNGAVRSVTNGATGQSFQPDFVWIKNRVNGTFWHQLYDVNRGPLKAVFSNDTSSESTYTDTLTAFTSTGFNLGTDATFNGGVNKSGDAYVAWQWKAGGAAVTNTAGTISAQVSANPTAGFSVVTYTGNGAAGANVGHGLGVAPSMMIVKQRGGTTNWAVYHASLPSAFGVAGTQVLNLNATTANTQNFDVWDSNNPSSSIFSVGASTLSNANGGTYVAYCFAPIAGYSAFGSYTGNGSADGPFVYLGFRPRFIMIKRTDSTGNWTLDDSARSAFNVGTITTPLLYPNLSIAEANGGIDILSNGFKIRFTDGDYNTNGGTYMYACFAENPFKYANAR